jgi:hypothetical protein
MIFLLRIVSSIQYAVYNIWYIVYIVYTVYTVYIIYSIGIDADTSTLMRCLCRRDPAKYLFWVEIDINRFILIYICLPLLPILQVSNMTSTSIFELLDACTCTCIWGLSPSFSRNWAVLGLPMGVLSSTPTQFLTFLNEEGAKT